MKPVLPVRLPVRNHVFFVYFSFLSLSFSANDADNFVEQVVKTKPPNSFFVSTIGDFAQDQTVFSKSTATHWKPVMLISQGRVTS
jgi:hypothetical protein